MYRQLLVIGLICLCACDQATNPEENGPEIFPRESKIPTDAVKMTPEMDDHPPILHVDEYEEPVPMVGPVNTAGAEDSAFMTADGQHLYFFFTPDVDVPVEQQLTDGVTGIYWSRRVGGSWAEPERVVLNDDVSLDGCQFVQGNTMWFCSVRARNMREIDIYTAELVGGKWTNWQNVGERLNLEIGVGELHLSADGTQLYFHADNKPGGSGGRDIWVTRQLNGFWQDAEPIDAVNTTGDEGWPYLTDNGNELWFTRTHLGTPAIFRSRLAGGEWQEPEMIISQFAGEPTLDEEGNVYFAHHFFKSGEMIEADIYVAMRR